MGAPAKSVGAPFLRIPKVIRHREEQDGCASPEAPVVSSYALPLRDLRVTDRPESRKHLASSHLLGEARQEHEHQVRR